MRQCVGDEVSLAPLEDEDTNGTNTMKTTAEHQLVSNDARAQSRDRMAGPPSLNPLLVVVVVRQWGLPPPALPGVVGTVPVDEALSRPTAPNRCLLRVSHMVFVT